MTKGKKKCQTNEQDKMPDLFTNDVYLPLFKVIQVSDMRAPCKNITFNTELMSLRIVLS